MIWNFNRLTSFVLKSLLDAKEHIEIELGDIEKGLENILLAQDIDGQFREHLNARIIHSKMQVGKVLYKIIVKNV